MSAVSLILGEDYAVEVGEEEAGALCEFFIVEEVVEGVEGEYYEFFPVEEVGKMGVVVALFVAEEVEEEAAALYFVL